jgi:predicted DNA-binding protein|tara:strand:+ start:778 stop:978 length:201 start_codon:yes stop_codon:yes gene_type:complete
MKYKKQRKTKSIRVRVDNKLWKRLDQYCNDLDETKSNFLRALVISFLQKVENDIREEGLIYDQVIV